jgi:hypothetical protein
MSRCVLFIDSLLFDVSHILNVSCRQANSAFAGSTTQVQECSGKSVSVPFSANSYIGWQGSLNCSGELQEEREQCRVPFCTFRDVNVPD